MASSTATEDTYSATADITTTEALYPTPWPSLITQFSVPPGCASLFTRSGNGTNTWSNQTTLTYVSDESNPKFSSCNPPGWDQKHFHFSPGVCPSGWTYFGMTATQTGRVWDVVKFTQAICCAEGYTGYPGHYYSEAPLGCVSTASRSHTIYEHEPILLHWQKKDTKSFPFKMPKLDGDRSLTTWVPGQTLAPNEGYLSAQGCEYFCFSTAGLVCLCLFSSLAFLAAVGCCITCCVKCSRRKKRRALQLALSDAIEQNAQRQWQKSETEQAKTVEVTDKEVSTVVEDKPKTL